MLSFVVVALLVRISYVSVHIQQDTKKLFNLQCVNKTRVNRSMKIAIWKQETASQAFPHTYTKKETKRQKYILALYWTILPASNTKLCENSSRNASGSYANDRFQNRREPFNIPGHSHHRRRIHQRIKSRYTDGRLSVIGTNAPGEVKYNCSSESGEQFILERRGDHLSPSSVCWRSRARLMYIYSASGTLDAAPNVTLDSPAFSSELDLYSIGQREGRWNTGGGFRKLKE